MLDAQFVYTREGDINSTGLMLVLSCVSFVFSSIAQGVSGYQQNKKLTETQKIFQVAEN